MKKTDLNLRLVIIILSVSIITWSCSGDETLEENKTPQISTLTSSSNTVGFGNDISLVVEGIDNDGDKLTYSWSSDEGEFSNNSKGEALTWTAPHNSKTFALKLEVSDGKDKVEESVLVDVIPAYIGFKSNNILNFSINTSYCELEMEDSTASIRPLLDGYVGSISSPEFSPRLQLPYSIESTLGLFQNLEDSNDYYYLSMIPSNSKTDDKVLTEVAVYLNPNGTTSNWRIVAKTLIKSTGERKTTKLKSGTSSSLKTVGELNNVSLLIGEDKKMTLKLNDQTLYSGLILKEFMENTKFNSNWEMTRGLIGVSSGDNVLTIDEIRIK